MASRPGERYLRWRGRAGRLHHRFARNRQLGRAPEVALETTQLGPVLDEAVLQAKRRMRTGADPDYDLLYDNFDVLHYLLQSPELIGEPDVDLIGHFLAHGREKGLSPHPDFSMTEYLARYPKRRARRRAGNPFLFWLKHGRSAGEIADPAPGVERMAPILGLSPQQLADAFAERRRDLQQRFRTGRLGEMFARAAEIEPLIGATLPEIARPHLVPLTRRVVVGELCAIYEAQAAARFAPARVVLVIGPARHGEMANHLVHALATRADPAEVVVIHTEAGTVSPDGRFADGVREIDFARMTRDLRRDAAEHALVMLLRSFRADALVNVESRLLYQALRSYGRALAAADRLFLCLSDNEQTRLGTWTGWGMSDFYRTFGYVAGVITNSDHLARELIATYRVGAKDRERLHVLPDMAGAADVLLVDRTAE